MQPLKRNSIKTLLPAFLTALLTSSATFAAEPIKAQATEQTLPSFKEIAKKASPAVVLIKVQANLSKKGSSSSDQFDYQDPFDTFNEDFWRFFFGTPPQSPRQQRKQQPVIGQGSGFIVSADGYILTNNHVIKDAESVQVVLNNGKEFDATIIGQDPNTDLAVIKIEEKNLPFLALGDSDALEVGDWVTAIGTPLNLQTTVTAGIVSAKGRNNLRLAELENFIQTDTAINQGNSGGPLINMQGEVIGINTAIASNTGGYMGIGFAIPSNMAHYVMDQLIKSGSVTRGFLGVIMQPIDNELAQGFNLSSTEGALVSDVLKGSPADQAGLQQGDIILKLNNQKVEHVFSFRNAISLMAPGTKITVEILRQGNKMEKTIEIGTQPQNDQNLPAVTMALGFEVEEYTPEIAKQLGYPEEKGVLIKNVIPGSIAHEVGLKRGALIVAVNQQKVDSIEAFNEAIQQMLQETPQDKKNQRVLLLLVRQGPVISFVSLKLKK